MTRACDVLVIGLGPAGASAAAAAARTGLSVIAVESKKLVGVPVQSAEFIPLPPSRQARGDRIPGGMLIHRDRFDQALARTAELAGALLWIDTALRWIDTGARTARVGTANGMREIRYEVLVAADGPASAVAASLGLQRLPIASTRQYTLPLLKSHADTDIWLSPRYPGGYAWLFPKGKVANLGLGLDHGAESDMREPLDELHASLAASRRVGTQILFRSGGPICVGGLRARLVEDRVLFAGDAAGLAHPLTGAGIAPAIASGARAGTAAAEWLSGEPHALDAYEQDMREQFGPSIERGLAARRRMAEIWKTRAAGDGDLRRGWIAYPQYFAKDPT